MAYAYHVTFQKEQQQVASLTSGDDIESRAAKRLGIDDKGYVRTFDLLKEAEAKGDISDAEWAELKALANHPQPKIDAAALSAMIDLRKSPRHDEILTIARSKRTDADQNVRITALILLYQCNAPEWRSEVATMSHSSDQQERNVAGAILRRDAGLPPAPFGSPTTTPPPTH
jgi:hypothetical protein